MPASNFVYFGVQGNINGERIFEVGTSQFGMQTKGNLYKAVKLHEILEKYD